MESVLTFDNESQKLLNLFFEKKKRTGDRTMISYKSAIMRFLNYVGKSNFRDIDRLDAESFLSYMDSGFEENKDLKLSYKKTQLRILKSFFDELEEYYRSKGNLYFSPIPKTKFYSFTPNKPISMIEKQKNDDQNAFTIDQLILLIKKAKRANYDHYIQILLLTFCGMRISEVVSIKKENLNINERYLMTGIEPNCRKSNRDGENPLIFCYPKEISDILFDYLQYHSKKYSGSEWLFPSPSNIHQYSNIRKLQRFLESLNLSFEVHSHKFRKTIETFQAYKTNNTPLHFIELLSNHVISSVVYKHYAKCSLEERIGYYDFYLPKEYKAILPFI